MSDFKLPTETIELPSKGLLYSSDSPLAKGTIDMKYMTAREEDILTNTNYINNGTVIDKLLQSLITTEGVNYGDLLIGDKNAIMVAARILSYGKDYSFKYNGEEITVDLTGIEAKEIDESLYVDRKNEFQFTLPHSENLVTFKILTHKDERDIEAEIKGLKRINKDENREVTTRLKYMITGVNGRTEQKDIREFVDKYLLARDARALREEYSRISPDVKLEFYPDGEEEVVDLPITINFFWPDAGK